MPPLGQAVAKRLSAELQPHSGIPSGVPPQKPDAPGLELLRLLRRGVRGREQQPPRTSTGACVCLAVWVRASVCI